MADKLTPERRSRNMARIRAKDSSPEMRVRRLAHRLGYRYRLHRKDLPGKPDLVFASRKAAVFVHGCFWHQHPEPSCKDARRPKSRQDYWDPKLDGNIQRDARHIQALEAAGWSVMTVWECETLADDELEARLKAFLDRSV